MQRKSRYVIACRILGGILAATFVPICIAMLYHGQGLHALSDALLYAAPAAIGLALFIICDTRQEQRATQEQPSDQAGRQSPGPFEPSEQEPPTENRIPTSPNTQQQIILALIILLIWATLLAVYLLTPQRP